MIQRAAKQCFPQDHLVTRFTPAQGSTIYQVTSDQPWCFRISAHGMELISGEMAQDIQIQFAETVADGVSRFDGLSPGWYGMMDSSDHTMPEDDEDLEFGM